MNRERILEVLEELARSQGLYGRILRDITEDDLEYLETQKFEDALDLVMYFGI